MNAGKLKSATHIGSALVIAAAFSGCLNMSKDTGATTNGASAGSAALLNANYVGTAGVKTVDAMFKSLAVVTGMGNSAATLGSSNPTTVTYLANQMGYQGKNTIGSQFQTIRPFLSANGQFTTVNPAMLLSWTGVVGQACSVMAANEAGGITKILAGTGLTFAGTFTFTGNTAGTTTYTISSASNTAGLVSGMSITGTDIASSTTIASISGNTITLSKKTTGTANGTTFTVTVSDFSGDWNQQFTASTNSNVNASVATALATRFWGGPPTAAELGILTSAMQNLATSVSDSGSQGVQDVLTGICTVMLVSPKFLAA